jgi:hypothetical protein
MGVACTMHRMDKKCIQLVGHSEGNNRSEDLDVYGRIILKWISNRMGEYGLHSCFSGLSPVAGSCEHENQSSGSVKCRGSLD